MGQAKRNAANTAHIQSMIESKSLDIARLAGAVRKLFQAASAKLGGDCYDHAALGQAFLKDLGIPSEIVCGEAAWRVGEGDSDVILHGKQPGMVPQPGSLATHAWIELGGLILDLTTYQLPEKGKRLDALDGGHTDVIWHPDFLFVRKDQVSTLADVTQKHAGLFFYRRDPVIEASIKRSAQPTDPEELQHVHFLYANPHITVIGPNDMKATSI